MRHIPGEANHGPICSKVVSHVKYMYNEYTLEERVKMGRHGAKNSC